MNDKKNIGINIISDFVKTLPASPGVYRMIDEKTNVIYVGKARSLKARVSNYTRYEGNSNRICRMICATRSMEFVRTKTESEALLLEANMIKRLKPWYNVLLRDDKSFPYILINSDHEAPQLSKHRGKRRRKGHYFGPFASGQSVDRTIAVLQKAFLLRNCTDSYYANRNRPCLQHQIKRCAAPCTGEISLEDYQGLVENGISFLSGKSKAMQKLLSGQMQAAAKQQDFESAAILRDRLSALTYIVGQNDMNARLVEEADIFAIHQTAGQFCVQVFFYRAFQNWGNHAFYPRADAELKNGEVLEAFISQFYENRIPPKLILVSDLPDENKLLEAALSSKLNTKVSIAAPKRGEKFEMVMGALNNAKEALGRQLAQTSSQKNLLKKMAEVFDLKTPPRRIEVYDNSHISGTNAVGAMIVAGVAGFDKKQYRTFNIKSETITPGDDFGMMSEVLGRRFARLVKDGLQKKSENIDESEMPDWPDVILIDGGKGQLSAVKKQLDEYGLSEKITLIGIAKGEERNAGRETFFMEGKQSFMLGARDPVLYFVQRLRDEAHRFAIGTHRAKRKKDIVKNPLDEIAGIGASRKRALLNHFGSAKAVSRAALIDLTKVNGISKNMASLIYDHFNQ